MSKNIECVICLETLSEKYCYPSPKEATCAHATCKKCLCSYLKEMPDGEYHLGYVSLECPDFACKKIVKTYIDDNIDIRKQAYARWKHLFQKKADISYKIFCPMEGCGQVLQSDKQLQEKCTFVICRSCNRAFCSACQNKWHTNVVKRVDDMELRRLSLKTAKEKNWCVCPKCNRIIDKVGGCQHIKCICGSKICYQCGRLLHVCKNLCSAYDSARLKKLRDTMFE